MNSLVQYLRILLIIGAGIYLISRVLFVPVSHSISDSIAMISVFMVLIANGLAGILSLKEENQELTSKITLVSLMILVAIFILPTAATSLPLNL